MTQAVAHASRFSDDWTITHADTKRNGNTYRPVGPITRYYKELGQQTGKDCLFGRCDAADEGQSVGVVAVDEVACDTAALIGRRWAPFETHSGVGGVGPTDAGRGAITDQVVRVRGSKDVDGPQLAVKRECWARFARETAR